MIYMKNGLVVFKETENIGDDIQSYAALRHLPKIDYYIEREELDLFIPTKKERVLTIMNGWYLHSKINFPLSPYIYPIFISTHFSSYKSGGIKTEYLNDFSKTELLKYAPIGCRDSGTAKILDEYKIPNYFSGCLTLTIEKDPTIEKKDYICLVDIDPKVENCIYNNLGTKYEIIKKTHTLNKEKNMQLSWEERFSNVKKLLDTYQSAKLVVTSRLHCALPCLALNTPVLLLYNEEDIYIKDRLSDYTKLLNFMSTKEFLSKGIKTLKKGIKNSDKYLKIKNSLETKLQQSIKEATKNNLNSTLPALKDYKDLYIKPKKHFDKIYHLAVKQMEIDERNYINLKYEKDYWQKEFNNLLLKVNEYNNLTTERNYLSKKYDEIIKENSFLKKKLSKYEKKEKVIKRSKNEHKK